MGQLLKGIIGFGTGNFFLERFDHILEGYLCPKKKTGPGCSKLTTSLVNETLKFQTLIFQICQYFLLEKCEKLLQSLIFSTKNISVFGYKVLKHLTS